MAETGLGLLFGTVAPKQVGQCFARDGLVFMGKKRQKRGDFLLGKLNVCPIGPNSQRTKQTDAQRIFWA